MKRTLSLPAPVSAGSAVSAAESGPGDRNSPRSRRGRGDFTRRDSRPAGPASQRIQMIRGAGIFSRITMASGARSVEAGTATVFSLKEILVGEEQGAKVMHHTPGVFALGDLGQ